MDLLIASPNEPFIAWANTATKTTMARPIMSAAAVAAVRLGLRPALSRARRPLVGASFSIGQPMIRLAGRTTNLASMATATKSSRRAEAHEEQAAVGPAVGEDAEGEGAAAEGREGQGMAVLNFAKRVGGRAAPSWRAATGGTRVARRAGASAERSVTPTPTSTAMRIVRGSRAMPAVGMSAPSALKSRLMPLATPRPAPMPTAEASTPSASASATTDVSTWRRLAPSARSIANSRRRCATVMLKALKMMKAPTKTETPANARSTGVRNEPIASAVSAVASAAACSPVLTLTPAGMAALTPAASCLGRHAGIGGDGDGADPAGLAAPALHVLKAAGDDDGAAEGAGLAPLEHAGDLDLLEAGRAGDGEGVAGLEAGLVGEALDDRDFVTALRSHRPRRGSPG